MNTYFAFAIICAASSIFDQAKNNNSVLLRGILFLYLSIFLIIFAGFRYETGYDYEGYKNIFEAIIQNIHFSELLIEPGFWIIFRGLDFFEFPFALAFVTLFSIAIKLYVIKKWSPMPIYSLLIYFSGVFLEKDFGQIRHGLAMALFLLSMYLILANYRARGYLSFLAAFLVHYSAIVALPIILLRQYLIKRQILLLMLVFGLAGFLVDVNNVAIILNAISPESHIGLKAYSHATENNLENIGLGINASLLFRLVMSLALIYYLNTLIAIRPLYAQALVVFYVYGLFVYLIFNSNSEFAIRLSAYFKMLDIFAIPLLICAVRSVYLKILTFLLGVAYSIYSVLKLMNHPELSWNFIPYKNYLFF
jgi:hypothetical protein